MQKNGQADRANQSAGVCLFFQSVLTIYMFYCLATIFLSSINIGELFPVKY